MNQHARNEVWRHLDNQIKMIQGQMRDKKISEASGFFDFGNDNTSFNSDFTNPEAGWTDVNSGGEDITMLPRAILGRGRGGGEDVVYPTDPDEEDTFTFREAFALLMDDLKDFITQTMSPTPFERDLSRLEIHIPATGDLRVETVQPVKSPWTAKETSSVDLAVADRISYFDFRMTGRQEFEAEAAEHIVSDARKRFRDYEESDWVIWDPREDGDGYLLVGNDIVAMRNAFDQHSMAWSEEDVPEPAGPKM
ncbi:hypothetical protein [Salipiger sp. PrR003]|uniref:hypothetical protein n=1 Tax=Salipiger sp. PrR003 TaxID=2706776 RepID=UPI0013D9C810|nr:hypothetical protein [Salipiger sp. PrR003]NDV50352.1 hypothetical protein [Salipiger sp. PrR003]